ncbi:hypothetical protein Hanom_Chr05g00425711 [Helianthus anomalus]
MNTKGNQVSNLLNRVYFQYRIGIDFRHFWYRFGIGIQRFLPSNTGTEPCRAVPGIFGTGNHFEGFSVTVFSVPVGTKLIKSCSNASNCTSLDYLSCTIQ